MVPLALNGRESPGRIWLRRVCAYVCFTVLVVSSSFALSVYAEVIRVGLTLPKDAPEVAYVNGMFENFKSYVQEVSGGTLQVQIYYGGVLGKPDDRLNQVRRNVIQMTDASEGNYATIHRDIQVFSIPYLFSSADEATDLLDGPVGARIAEDIRAATGIRVLGWWEAGGFRHYSANAPIETLDDFRGKKIRVMSAVFSIPVTAMGGAAIPVPLSELYISLSTGVVDGQDNPFTVFNMYKLHEVQNYITVDSHSYSFGPMGINDRFFNSLNKDHQRIVKEAATRAIAWNRRMSRNMEADAIESARSNAVTLIAIPEEMRTQFAQKAQPAVIDWLRRSMDRPELIEVVLNETRRQSAE